MDITGLENNYYLAGNDIWVQVSNFAKTPIRLDLKVINLNNLDTLPIFRLYPDITNRFWFNVSQTVRPLQPYPDHININTLQNYSLQFTVTFDDDTADSITLEKYFIRGGRDKNNVDQWYLSSSAPLIIEKWVDWRGIVLPGFAKKIQNNLIVDFIPSAADTYKMILPSGCNAKIVKFLNSLGGYQFWIFETNEVETKVRSKDLISQIPMSLRGDVSRNIGTESVKTITLKTKTPKDLQPIIVDLIESPEVLIYDPAGTDALSSWHRIQLANSNEAVLNTNDMSYFNELDYIIPNYVNRDL